MAEERSSYRKIVKATSLFGGVQFFNIIIAIIRSKFIAVLLGPAGMGIAGLLSTTLGVIGGVTSFGLGTSAVKDVASANATGDLQRMATIVSVFRRLIWITGVFGTLVVIVLSPWLSELTFGNRDYTVSFIWISVTLLFNQLCSEHYVVLQGMQKLQHLAKAGVIGSALSLVITLPLYFWYGIDGIVPAMIITSLISLLVAWLFGRTIKIGPVKTSWITTYAEGKNMLIMGFVITVNGFVLMGASYVVRIFIGKTGGLDDVGLYSSGFAIINSYVGMIFTAMVTDYYPRLSAVAHDNLLCSRTINQQADITLLILGPIIMVFLVFIKIVVIVLLSKKFIPITGMLDWAMLGVFFKAASWPVGFLFIPKGNSKLALLSELAANGYMLLFNILGYYYFGLEGLGIAFLAGYIVYLAQVFIIAKAKYTFAFERSFYKIFCIQLIFGIFSFMIAKEMPEPWSYLAGMVFISVSCIYSYRELDKRIGIREVFVGLKSRFKPGNDKP